MVMDMKKTMPWVTLCLPALCLSLACLGACGGGEDEEGPDESGVTDAGHSSGDAGHSGSDASTQGDASEEEGRWPKIKSDDYAAFYEFIPEGAFAIRTLNGEVARMVAKSADGSITVAELSAKKADDAHWKQVKSWSIWKDHEYWNLHHDTIGSGENKQDRFFLDHMTDEKSDAAKAPRMVHPTEGYQWHTTNVTIDSINPLLFYYNYLDFPSDQAEYAGDVEIMGVTTHKYVTSNSSATAEWFVLDNGFCVKKNFRWAWSEEEWDKTESFEPVILELGSKDYDEVLQKYGVFYDQLDVTKTPAVSEMIVQTQADTSGAWIAPSHFQAWTHGSIDFAVNFRAMNWDNYPIYKIFVKMKPGTDLANEMEAYKTELLTIPDMALEGNGNGCLDVGGLDLGCTWEYSNDGDDCKAQYFFYRVKTAGTGLSGTDTPSSPDVIFSEMHKCVEV